MGNLRCWLCGFLRRLRPVRRAEAPRLPMDAWEAERVFQRWDSLNGRYYFRADVVLRDGSLRRDVLFDGDANIAVECDRRWVYLQPELFGRELAAWLVTEDYTAGGRYGRATAEQRDAFLSAHEKAMRTP